MSVDKEHLLDKIISMFRPCTDDNFLGFAGTDTIHGPNDRAAFGVDTNFPKEWLIEDFGFTEEEAAWFIDRVKQKATEQMREGEEG